MLESLKPVVEKICKEHGGLVDSAGFSVVAGLLSEADTWPPTVEPHRRIANVCPP